MLCTSVFPCEKELGGSCVEIRLPSGALPGCQLCSTGLPLEPRPSGLPIPLCLHYLNLTGVCSPLGWHTHTHSHTTQISGTNGPRVLLDPCPGSPQVSAPRVPFADKATSCLLKAWCSGSGPFLRSFSLPVFFFVFFFSSFFFSFFLKKTSNKKTMKKIGKCHVSEEMSLSVVFGELVS